MIATIMGLVVGMPSTALHWSGNGSFSPSVVYQEIWTHFVFHLVNMASGELDVYWVFVVFCWTHANFGPYFKPNDGSTTRIPGGASYDFNDTLQADPLADVTGNCAVTIEVDGQAAGDASPGIANYSSALDVRAVAPLQVSVSASPPSGTAPVAVSFSSNVSGGLAPYGYDWTFDHGGTGSSAANVTLTFEIVGSYTARLTVTSFQGTVPPRTANVSVQVYAPLAANAAAKGATGTVPVSVSFTANASGGNGPYTYSWDFGDGATSVEQDPSHTYGVAGTYTATVTVTDADGRSATQAFHVLAISPWVWVLLAAAAIGVVATVAFVVRRRDRRVREAG